MNSQAPELRKRKIGITPFDRPRDKLVLPVEAFNGAAKQPGGMSAVLQAAPEYKPPKKIGNGPAGEPTEAAKVREWAKAQGMEVPERGRIPAEVTSKYREAHSQPARVSGLQEGQEHGQEVG